MAAIIDYCLKYDNREMMQEYFKEYNTRQERKYREIMKYRNNMEENEMENEKEKWKKWYKDNGDEIFNRISKRKKFIMLNDILGQMKMDKNEDNIMVYTEDIIKKIVSYSNIKEMGKLRKVCNRWKEYTDDMEKKYISKEKRCSNVLLHKYLTSSKITNIDEITWKNIMKREKFDPWIYYKDLTIYNMYDVIDIFYDIRLEEANIHYYNLNYTWYSNLSELEIGKIVDKHIKYTKDPFVLCIIYLANTKNCYKHLQSRKYYEKILSVDCSNLDNYQLGNKIVEEYPNPPKYNSEQYNQSISIIYD